MNDTNLRTLNIREIPIRLHLGTPATRHIAHNGKMYVMVGTTIWRHEMRDLRRAYRALRKGGMYDFEARNVILSLVNMNVNPVTVTL